MKEDIKTGIYRIDADVSIVMLKVGEMATPLEDKDGANFGQRFTVGEWKALCDHSAAKYGTDITREYLQNTYGEVESKEHADFIIELAKNTDLDIGTYSEKRDSHFYTDNDYIGFTDSEALASNGGEKKITIPMPPKEVEDVDANREKLFAGVARIGDGKRRSRNGGKKIKCYKVWEGMITRCYVESSQHYQRYGGRGVYVCDEWLNYQNFADWYLSQKNNSKPNFQIDKDLKIIGNKVYSPETCEIVPSRVNSLLISTNSRRGDLPVGVHALKDKFKASCRDEFGSKVHLGTFKTQTEAFSAYKNFKKGVVVCIANDELKKGNISYDVHQSLVLMEINPFPE